jgi:hypothetical protein
LMASRTYPVTRLMAVAMETARKCRPRDGASEAPSLPGSVVPAVLDTAFPFFYYASALFPSL